MASVDKVCNAHEECATGYCKAGICSKNQVKKPCAGSNAACPAKTKCHPDSRYCLRSNYQLPESCKNAYDCEWGKFCNEQHQCIEKFKRGQSCSGDKQCADGIICVDGKCVKRCIKGANNCQKDEECIEIGTRQGYCNSLPAAPTLKSTDSFLFDSEGLLLPPYIFFPLLAVILFVLILLIRFFWRILAKRRRLNRNVEITRQYKGVNSNNEISDHDLSLPLPSSPPPLLSPVPSWTQASRPELLLEPVQSNLNKGFVPNLPIETLQDPTLPVWPETKMILPDPFEEDIPHTPIERKEFSSPLNIAAPIGVEQHVPTYVSSKDPSIDSQTAWQ